MNAAPASLVSRTLVRIACLGLTFLLPHASAQAQEANPSAQELAARLTANIEDGSSSARLKLEIQPATGGPRTVLQLQIKARRTKTSTDIVYAVLWPKERKGESFLLHKGPDRVPTGKVFIPPATMTTLSPSQMKEAVFGSDLSYEDLVENFFAWQNQTITGTETVDRVPCQILESKPGKGDRSLYPKVRSWIDVKRMVPLRVEKYSGSGQLAKRIITTRVAKDDSGRLVPASMTVQRAGAGSLTEIEGSKSRNDVVFQDSDFTPEALKRLAAPATTPQ